jgi:hypothetical protein
VGGSTRPEGTKRSFEISGVLWVACLSLRAQGKCSGLRAWAGGGIKAQSEKTLEGKKPRRVSTVGEGQLASIANGLVKGTKLRSR